MQALLNQVLAFGTDFVSFIVLTVLVLLFSLYFGRDRFPALIAGLYAALAVYSVFPYTFGFLAEPWAKIGLFVVFAGLSFVAFSGLSYFVARAGGSFFSSVVLSILVAGFALAVAIHTLPGMQVYHFSDATKALFTSNQAFFWWLVAPLAGLFLFGG